MIRYCMSVLSLFIALQVSLGLLDYFTN